MKGDQMNFVIRIATEKDIDELEVLYDALNDPVMGPQINELINRL